MLADRYDALPENQKAKRAVEVHVPLRISRTGKPRITEFTVENEPTLSRSQGSDDQLGAALAAARSRGRTRVAEILSGDEMLSADEFADRIGVSKMTVNNWRQSHRILGLRGAKPGFKYPEWQIGSDGRPFAVLPALFDRLGEEWAVYRFLIQQHAELNNLTGREALQRDEANRVIEVAESVAQAFT
jgi:hypothetical protein